MDAVLNALEEQHAELAGLLDGLGAADWQRATPCEGWTVADVVLHLAQTDELALASLEGRFGEGLEVLAGGVSPQPNVDDGAAAMVARERGVAPGALRERWRSGSAALRGSLASDDPHRRVSWVAGQLSTRTLTSTRLSECWIHTGDVAAAVGANVEPSDRLEHVARLAWRTLPYAFARDGRQLIGPVAFDLRGPSGAEWHFVPDTAPTTIIEGDGAELCLVAARRVAADETSLRGSGPDAVAVLELVRTYA